MFIAFADFCRSLACIYLYLIITRGHIFSHRCWVVTGVNRLVRSPNNGLGLLKNGLQMLTTLAFSVSTQVIHCNFANSSFLYCLHRYCILLFRNSSIICYRVSVPMRLPYQITYMKNCCYNCDFSTLEL